ncbi:hypothetical protein ACF0H5_022035 [Mactra antiquata]
MADTDNMDVKGGRFVLLKDEEGGEFQLYHYEDLIQAKYLPLMFEPKEFFSSIKNLQYKKGDIFVCAYPKSGNHWFSNIINHMLSTKDLDEIEFINVPLLETPIMKTLQERPSPRLFVSHLPDSRLPRLHFENGGKIILILRNPKDVVVSYWYHLSKDRHLGCSLSWSGFLEHFMKGNVLFGSYFDYLKKWQRLIQDQKYSSILYVYYEDLKERPLEELQKVQKFLGTDGTTHRLNQIITKCSFNNLKSNVDSGRLRTTLVDENKQPFVYRKGEIGDWMNHFTVLQNKQFDELLDRELKDSIFKFRYRPSTHRIPKHQL